MASSSRVLRIGDMIQKTLSQALQREVHDPRLKFVSVTAVEVSRDLAHAKVYISVLSVGDSEADKIKDALLALEKAGPFLKRLLAKDSSLRTVPNLIFMHDQSSSYGSKMSNLIDKARKDDGDSDEEEA